MSVVTLVLLKTNSFFNHLILSAENVYFKKKKKHILPVIFPQVKTKMITHVKPVHKDEYELYHPRELQIPSPSNVQVHR